MKKIIDSIEKKSIGLWDFVLCVFVISTMRDIIETVLKKNVIHEFPLEPLLALKVFFLHFNSFYFLTFMVLSLLIYSFTSKNNNISNCFKVGLFAMLIILFPPIFDTLIGNKEMMMYPANPLLVIKDLPNFLFPFHEIYGITIGMRYEIFIASLLAGYYIYLKTKKVWKTVIGGISFFAVILSIGFIIPTICQLFENGLDFKDDFRLSACSLLQTGEVLVRSTQKISCLYIFLIICFTAIAYYIYDMQKCKAIVVNFRATRFIHYLLLFLAGFMLVFFVTPPSFEDDDILIKTFLFNNPFEYFGVFMAGLSVFFSFQSAVIFNDIYDFEIDKISNSKRPLITNILEVTEYKNIAKLFLLFAIVIAFCINEAFFLMILAYNSLAFLYSNPPFRLRKYFGIANVVLSVIALITFHSGATILTQELSFITIPSNISLALLIGFCFATTIKDVKDVEGDRINKVKTLLTLFGEKWGLIVTSIFITATIIILPFLMKINDFLLISIIIAGIFNVVLFFINFKKETLIFLLYYFYIIILFYKLLNL